MVERVVYVGATLQVILHLASGQTVQAWIPNDGDAQSRASGDAIVAHFPIDALRVLARRWKRGPGLRRAGRRQRLSGAQSCVAKSLTPPAARAPS